MMMIMLLQCEREKRGAVRKGEAEVHAKRAEERFSLLLYFLNESKLSFYWDIKLEFVKKHNFMATKCRSPFLSAAYFSAHTYVAACACVYVCMGVCVFGFSHSITILSHLVFRFFFLAF